MTNPSGDNSLSQAQNITEAEIFSAHEGGKLNIDLTGPLEDRRDLSIAYTPGVARVSAAIAEDPSLADTHTWAPRLVAVISDGTAVLGLGNIGPSASLPVMEGKSVLIKRFADLNSIPIVLNTTDPDEIVETIIRISPSFGAVNLEDISAPRCFEIEERLVEALDIPVMHDDQHGTAIVVLAALTNALKITGKTLSESRVVVLGAGSAGVAVSEILLASGAEDLILVDSQGALHADRHDLSGKKRDIAKRSNPRQVSGGVTEAMANADIFIGVSPTKVTEEQVASMAADSIVFALANPEPEIAPETALKYAAVVATGRSDFPNQINNVLAFPGVFRGAIDAGAKKITTEMKLAAAEAIAGMVAEPHADLIVPNPFTPGVAEAVANAVGKAAGN